MKTNEVVGVAKLKSSFDKYAPGVLSFYDYVAKERTERGESGRRLPARYRVLKDLPSKEEYTGLRNKKYTVHVADLIQSAYGELESLKDELSDWFENLPESFQSGSKGDELQEAMDCLDGICSNNPSCDFPDIQVVFLPNLDASSRSDRASEASDQLREAAEALRNWADEAVGLGEDEDEVNDEDTEGSETTSPDEMREIADLLETDSDEISGISFPSMYS